MFQADNKKRGGLVPPSCHFVDNVHEEYYP